MKYHLFLGCFLLSFVVFSQANVTSSAISVQGIAKTETNVALANINNLSCDFDLYFLGEGNQEISLLSVRDQVKTDSYGVFQYVLSINQEIFHKIGNTQAYLKVSSGGEVFVNERLGVAPYAFYAQNGFITGSIVAYTGSVATSGDIPEGWLYCNGANIPSGERYQALRDLIGNSVPDLRGWFLRGTGESGENENYVGPDLGSTQGSMFKEHKHSLDITSQADGRHSHRIRTYGWQSKGNEPEGRNDDDFRIVSDNHRSQLTWRPDDLEENGEHSHALIGYTQFQSGPSNSSTIFNVRPVNYGVAYLIKI